MGDASGALGKMPPLAPKTFAKVAEGAGKISKMTFTRHFTLYNGYINKCNEIVGKLKNVGLSNANQAFSDLRELKVELTFAWGGVVNHEIYFNNLGGKGGEPDGNLADAVKRDFGSFANFKADMKATGLAARGWVWLATSRDGYLFNYLGDAQNSYPVWGASPILALDTYEHAYWLDTANRGEYIDNFFEVIDWADVSARYAKAMGQ